MYIEIYIYTFIHNFADVLYDESIHLCLANAIYHILSGKTDGSAECIIANTVRNEITIDKFFHIASNLLFLSFIV